MAASGTGGDNVTLAKGDNRTGTFYATGNIVTINGDVDGDLVCFGQTVVVNGSVTGDVLCAAQNLTVNGPVTGSVRSLGQLVTINGTVGRNVTVAAQSLVLGSGSHVIGEAAVAAQSVAINGPVDRDVLASAATFELGSTIGGSLSYVSDRTFALDRSKVKGGVTRQTPPQHKNQQQSVADRLWSLIFWIASGLAMTLAAVWLTPRLVRGVTNVMIKRPGASLGWGALALVAGPAILLVLAFTVVGLPLSLLAAGFWLAGVLTAELFAGVAIGLMALGRKETDQKHLAMAAMAGVPLVLILSWLPWLGFFVGLGAAAWAMGGLVLSLNNARSLG